MLHLVVAMHLTVHDCNTGNLLEERSKVITVVG